VLGVNCAAFWHRAFPKSNKEQNRRTSICYYGICPKTK
jgi:hypothetical protein